MKEYALALSSIDKAIELDSNFSKAYAVKGDIHYLMQDFQKAIDAYEACKKIVPANEAAIERANLGLKKIQEGLNAVNAANTGNDEERMAQAMADPEIQALLQDPQVIKALQTIQTDPSSAAAALEDPLISVAIAKLIAAGVIKIA